MQGTWNHEVRPFVEDALRCYNAGAYRSAIVATWTAVCADVFEKVLLLAEDGDGRAALVAHDLELARAEVHTAPGTKRAQRLEDSLISTAHDLELIDALGKQQLERLREDRHLCAHPSLHPTGGYFSATAESARLHLAVASDSLLSHGPAQGRHAVDRFLRYVADQGFRPNAQYIVNAFLEPCGSAARKSIIEIAVKHAVLELEVEDDDSEVGATALADRLGDCVIAFADADRTSVSATMSKCVQRWDSSPSDVKIRAVARLGVLDIFWDAVSPESIEYIDALIADSEVDELPPALMSLVTSTTATDHLPSLAGRLPGLPATHLAQAIAVRPDPLFVSHAPALLRGARSYRSAEAIFESGVLPLASWFDVDTLRAVLDAWARNNQCVLAGAMPDNAVHLFERSRGLLPESLEDWKSFLAAVQDMARGFSFYQYPALEERIRAAGG